MTLTVTDSEWTINSSTDLHNEQVITGDETMNSQSLSDRLKLNVSCSARCYLRE